MSETQRSQLPLTFLSLFSSLSTLVCCALPALLVSLGMGAALAGLISAVPQLVWLSEHKVWVFGFSGAMMAIAGASLYRSKDLPCPIDPRQRAACIAGRRISVFVYFFALLCLFVGVLFAFILPSLG